MAGIKPIDRSQETWERRSLSAAPDYVRGSQNPRRPWAASAIAGAANYKSQVTAAANAGRYEKMVAKVGDAKWQGGIQRKGEANYQTGVAGMGQAWGQGFGPYQQAYSSFAPLKRGPKNSPQNYQNAQAVGQLFAQTKARLAG